MMIVSHAVRYLCKSCDAESPRGIGYATDEIGPMTAPDSTCPNPHA